MTCLVEEYKLNLSLTYDLAEEWKLSNYVNYYNTFSKQELNTHTHKLYCENNIVSYWSYS